MQSKVFTLVLLGILAVSFLNADSSLGMKGGVNLASLTGDDLADDLEPRMGFVAGGFLVFRVSDLLTIQPEFLYTTKGATYEEDGYEYTWSYNYLEIPALLKLNLLAYSDNSPYLIVGPAIAVLLSAEGKVESDMYNDSAEIEDVAATEFSAVVGAGFEFNKFILEGRFNFGLSTIDDTSNEYDIRHNVISILAGIRL